MKIKNIVFINNDQMQIAKVGFAKGRFKLHWFDTVELTDIAMVNGIIVNDTVLVEALQNNKKHLKNCTLIFDSSSIFAKILPFPKLTKKQALTLVRSEFITTDGSENYFYDANIHFSKDKNTLIGYAVQRSMIEGILDVFDRADIKLDRIEIALNGLIKLVNTHPDMQGKTCIVNIVSHEHMISLLFEDGKYTFSTRSRLLEQPGTPLYARELFSKASSLVQFNRSQKSAHEITHSFYTGLDETDLLRLAYYAQSYDMIVEPVKFDTDSAENAVLENTVYLLAGYIKQKKDDTDLISVYRDSLTTKNHRKTALLIFFPVLIAILLICSYEYFLYQNRALERDVSYYKNTLDAALTTNQNANIDQIEIELNTLTDSVYLVDSVLRRLDVLSYINREKIVAVFAAGGTPVTFTTIAFDQIAGTVSITAVATDETHAAAFVRRLRELDLFVDFVYVGYEQSSKGFSFRVTCVLKAGGSDE